MSSTPYEIVARVVKTRGLEGEVVVHVADGLPFCFREGMTVHVVPPPLEGPRELSVEWAEGDDETACMLFSGLDDVDAAELLVGRNLLARRDDLGLYGPVASPFGRAVRDECHGDLGSVVEVIETPAHDVWVVRGPYGEVLVPVVEQMLVDVPEDPSLPVRVALVDGLVDAPVPGAGEGDGR